MLFGVITVLGVAVPAGCASRPINEPIAEVDPQSGCRPHRRVLLAVFNSHFAPSTDWDRKEQPPGFSAQLLQSAGVPIGRCSFETIETMNDIAEIWRWRRELNVAPKRLAGIPEAEAETSVPEVSLQVFDVSFDAIKDPEEQACFMNLPTSFVLESEQVDRLRDVAGRLLRKSEGLQAAVGELGGTPVR